MNNLLKKHAFLIIISFFYISLIIPADIKLPPEIKLPYKAHEMGLYITHFHPIGFSNKGHFAYILYKNESDGIGELTDFKFIIQNLVNDKIVYSLIYRNDEKGAIPLNTLWKKYHHDIQKNLNLYAIIPSEMVIEKLPYKTSNGELLSIRTENIPLPEEKSDEEFWRIKSYSAYASVQNKKEKLIHQNKNSKSLGIDIGGIINSPYESRVAVVLIETFYGFEGSVDRMPLIVGCRTDRGF